MVHTELQALGVAAGQPQTPAVQVAPTGHAWPQVAQLLLSVWVLVHVPPHTSGVGALQPPQMPPVQAWPAWQAWPQVPQLSKLVFRSSPAQGPLVATLAELELPWLADDDAVPLNAPEEDAPPLAEPEPVESAEPLEE